MDLPLEQIGDFCSAFPAREFYVSLPAAESAVRSKRQFNIIQTVTGLKVGCIIPATDFDRSQLTRGVAKRIGAGMQTIFAAPEDVILKKMQYYRLGGSDKHLRDIAGVLKVSGEQVDREYVAAHAAQFGLSDVWEAILLRVQQG